jgi:uncharacterized protein (DUF58 family)
VSRKRDAGLVTPDGRQGPGPLPGRLVQGLDLLVSRPTGGVLPGERRARGLGVATELAQLRPYEVGDDVRRLDASATARTGVPHVRLDVPERALTTWIVLDCSASMAFGTADRLKADVAEGAVSVLARLAIRRGGKVGLATAGAPNDRVLPSGSGRRALAEVRRAAGRGVAPDGTADPDALSAAIRRVGRVARQSGLVVVVSDFRDDPARWRGALAAIGGRHAVLAIEIRDPRESELPAVGRLSIVDPETGLRVEADTSDKRLRERFAAAEAERAAGVVDALRAARADHVVLRTDGDWLRELGRRLK